MQSCDGNKAPGPDGFNLNFFKAHWELHKRDVLKVFHDFYAHGKLVRGLNAAIIALIPKTENPNSIYDFRPVSLIGSIYKLISKILASRLQRVMPYIISENQFALTQGRKIADCILIANEVVHSMEKRVDGGFLVKLDFAKTYDNIDWVFLLNVSRDEIWKEMDPMD